jgi:hypothetical protein
MSQLLCPRCENGGNLEWEKPEDINLEVGIIVCRTCRSRYQGIPGWRLASEKPFKAGSVDFMSYVQIYIEDHPKGSCGTGPDGRWLLQDCDGKTVGYGSGMTDAAKRYVHLKYGQDPIRRTLP